MGGEQSSRQLPAPSKGGVSPSGRHDSTGLVFELLLLYFKYVHISCFSLTQQLILILTGRMSTDSLFNVHRIPISEFQVEVHRVLASPNFTKFHDGIFGGGGKIFGNLKNVKRA